MISYIYKENDNEEFELKSKLNIMKSSALQYFLFIVFLGIIVVRNRYVFYEEKKMSGVNFEEDLLLSFDGIECAYKFSLEQPIKTWMKTYITIQLDKLNKCSKAKYELLEKNGGSVFRVEAYSIYEIVSSMAVYIGNETYRAELILSFPRKYTIMILLSYVNGLGMESKHHVKPLLRQIPGSPIDAVVRLGQTPLNIRRHCKINESGQLPGRWVKCGKAIPNLERCGAWTTGDFDFDKLHGFRWLPYLCQHHQYTNDGIKKCFARNGWDDIVFAGDSHMRYRAYHWATRLYGSCHSCAKTYIKLVFEQVPRIEWIFDARGTRLPLTFPNISVPYEKYIHPKVRRSKFSWPFPPDAMQAKLFILNFGHWLLRETNDIKFIHEKLHAYGKAAQILQQIGKKVVWVNTNSLPWRTDSAVIKWRENTSPYRVKQFNDVADKIMQEYGIPTVNAFQISNGRIGATHDQTHYTKKLSGNDFGGVVENAITNAIVNLLCNPY